jgi:aquaporin Z
MNRFLVEFIGTFFLVLTIGCVSSVPAVGGFAPLAIAAVLMVMVYAGGHISGAHYNPAVTVGLTVRGRCSAQDAGSYIVAQISGAVLAVVMRSIVFASAPASVPAIQVVPAFFAELLFTFALVYVVLNVATAKANSGNSFYGLAIASTVLAGAYAVGSVSGGAFNPAVAIGGVLMGIFTTGTLWVYLAANLLGGILAGALFKVICPED